MPRSEPEEIQSGGVVRMLDVRAVFVHNDHLQSGIRKARRCPMCAKGLDGAYAAVEGAKSVDKKDEVSAGDGADKEEDAAHTRDFRDYTPGEADQLLGSG